MKVGRFSAGICSGIAFAVMAVASAPFAQPSFTSITACGPISKSGAYQLDKPISASTPGDCIVIKAPNVTLNLNQNGIAGPLTGVGIHVMRTAANVFIEGGGATISNFLEGVEIDSANAVVENFTAFNNGDAGVYLNGARLAKLSNFTANGNFNDGVRLSRASMNVVQGFYAENNGRYGIWLAASSRNTIDIGESDIDNNVTAGIYLGCSNTGPMGQPCKPALPPSSYNSIFDGYASGGSQGYGIAIDLGDNFNKIARITAAGNATADVMDENTDCGDNLWISIVYGTPYPAPDCIP
jgi:parallel beta-helix repeat protein